MYTSWPTRNDDGACPPGAFPPRGSLFRSQLDRATVVPGQVDFDWLEAQVASEYGALKEQWRAAEDRAAQAAAELARLGEQVERSVAELEAQNLRFGAALENMAQGLCVFDGQQRLIVCNRQFAEIYGLQLDRVRPGTSFREIIAHRYAAGSCPDMSQDQYLEWWSRKLVVAMHEESSVELRNGRVIAIRHQPMPDGGWVATHDDITERRSIEKRLAHMAHHDDLTGLANRVLLRERLTDALARAQRGAGCTVLCIDLDHFKTVNDTLGHRVGDELLRAVTDRMRQQVRETDILARLGGDEFAVVQCSPAPGDSSSLAQRLIDALSVPFEVGGQQIISGASIGIAVAPDDGLDPETLLKHADISLYKAKAEGRGCFRYFEAEMDSVVQMRRLLELDLRQAVARQDFHLHYQPLLNVETGQVSGFEALLRWSHPARGDVPPAAFIPLAEEIGLIVPIGAWVLREACAEAAAWPSDVSVAVNMSAVQFRTPGIVATVVDALDASGLPPNRLELEITESVMMETGSTCLASLRSLRALGVRIAMDDFGTGYSSLSALRNFPFDKVKIDQSFIRELTNNPESIAVIRAVTGICASLGMTTTAEGVETEDQLALLTAEHCTDVQGYLFSRPRPAHDIPALLRELGPARIPAASKVMA